MKKVYLILPNLDAGGAERITITIARLLSKEGYDVEFLNLGKNKGEMLSWIEPEFKIISFNCSRVLKAILHLKKFMVNNPHAVYFSSREHTNMVGLLAAKKAKTKIVVRIPNMPKNVLADGFYGFKLRVVKLVNQYLLKYAKIIIAQNEEMKKQIVEYYHLSNDKVIAINNPVDKDYILKSAKGCTNPYPTNGINFLNICNIAYSKGIDVLAKAWIKVRKNRPDANLYIVGRTSSDYAKTIIEQTKNQEGITFLGFKENPYPYLKYCDVFVLPSRMEGFPNVVLEAMCFNRPVACTTCVAVIKDIIQYGKNGFYCDIEDAEALAECMIKSASLENISNIYNLFDKQSLLNCFNPDIN